MSTLLYRVHAGYEGTRAHAHAPVCARLPTPASQLPWTGGKASNPDNAAASTPVYRDLALLVVSMQNAGHRGHLDTYVIGEGTAIPATAPQTGRTIAQVTAQARITPPPVRAVRRVSGAATVRLKGDWIILKTADRPRQCHHPTGPPGHQWAPGAVRQGQQGQGQVHRAAALHRGLGEATAPGAHSHWPAPR